MTPTVMASTHRRLNVISSCAPIARTAVAMIQSHSVRFGVTHCPLRDAERHADEHAEKAEAGVDGPGVFAAAGGADRGDGDARCDGGQRADQLPTAEAEDVARRGVRVDDEEDAR